MEQSGIRTDSESCYQGTEHTHCEEYHLVYWGRHGRFHSNGCKNTRGPEVYETG